MKFRHFIITRFNVNIYPIDFPQRIEDTWLALRFEFFQKICFPSIRTQRNQGFEWLVLFDEQTPARYKKLIDLFSRYENFTPLYCGEYKTIMPKVSAYMTENSRDVDWVLTTRLDNDDALSVDFVDSLHQIVRAMGEDELAPSDTLYINFPQGLQYSDGVVYDFEDATNAFVSLLERKENPHSVFWVDHPAIHDVAPVIQAKTKPLWLQNVHETNVYNYIRGEEIEGTDLLKDFKCDF
ncbi:MAG: putative rhamnosyl transferase [Pseudodesulfovibrio sp.]